MEQNYCPQCGENLSEKRVDGRVRDFCQNCEEVFWRNAKPFAGVVLVDEGEILMVKRGVKPSVGKWSIPAGYMEEDEGPEEAAVRELKEETNLEISKKDLTLFDTLLLQHPDGQYVLGIIFKAKYSKTQGNISPGTDAKEVELKNPEHLSENQVSLNSAKYLDLFEKAVSEP